MSTRVATLERRAANPLATPCWIGDLLPQTPFRRELTADVRAHSDDGDQRGTEALLDEGGCSLDVQSHCRFRPLGVALADGSEDGGVLF